VPIAPAIAQDFFEFTRGRDAERARSVMRARPTATRTKAARAAPSRVVTARAVPSMPAPLPEGPLLLVVSLDKQRLSVYSKGELVETSTVSTGTSSDPTPSGVFAILERQEEHHSTIFRGASMPFMQRLTLTGVALHSGHVTGRVASHGCIRLPHEYARRLFQATKLGGRVIVSADDPTPADVANVRLFEPVRIAAATTAAATEASLIVAGSTVEGGEARPVPAVDRSIDPRNGKVKGPGTLRRDDELRAAPVSILVSRAEGRVYVRHTFEPQIDAEIAISEPRRPLGTHVYTLTEMQPDGSGQRWSAVTVKLVPRRTAVRVLAGRSSRAARALETSRPGGGQDEGTPSTAAEAVERFSLPPAVIARVAPLLRPGASLVVTDLPPSNRMKTWWTDIIVSP